MASRYQQAMVSTPLYPTRVGKTRNSGFFSDRLSIVHRIAEWLVKLVSLNQTDMTFFRF
ncbi:MAG: hypothetical protein AAGL24_15870 [Pseudomonadota bacterium]